jgi:hypothetical protein
LLKIIISLKKPAIITLIKCPFLEMVIMGSKTAEGEMSFSKGIIFGGEVRDYNCSKAEETV